MTKIAEMGHESGTSDPELVASRQAAEAGSDVRSFDRGIRPS